MSRQCTNGDWDMITRFGDILYECGLLTSELKPSKSRFLLPEFVDWVGKTTVCDVWRHDLKGERGRSGHVPRHYWPFNLTTILPAKYVQCLDHVSLLSHGPGEVAWIRLSFSTFSCRISLGPPCRSCVTRRFPPRADRWISGFLSMILPATAPICCTRHSRLYTLRRQLIC
jgi:hypothetical protein